MQRLKDVRERRGLTQKDVAEMLQVKPATISRYENGTNEPDLKTLNWYADFFECSVDFLIGRTDSPELQKKELTIDGQPVEVEIDINRPELQNPSHLEELVRKMIDQALAERERNRDL